MNMRVGLGFDVHRLVPDRKLFLCGVEFDHPLGLLGHSDADAALHAVIDALLGAVAAGDIGQWFPDTDPEYKNADSKELLRQVMQSKVMKDYRIVNLDLVIIAQKPKILPMVPAMRKSLSELLDCGEEQISIKGKTTEKLGFTGREEGIAAEAVVLLQKL